MTLNVGTSGPSGCGILADMSEASKKPQLIGGRGYPREEKWFDHQIEMTHSYVNLVVPTPVPNSYELRQFRPEDETSYLTLFGLAFEKESVLPNTLKRQLTDG